MMLVRRRTLQGMAVSIVLPISAVRAEVSRALYQATAIVTGTDMRQRPLGFGRCLTEVLVKLTGSPSLANNPTVTDLSEHADALVASFSYVDPRAGLLHHDDQGTYDRSYELTVRFDPAKVDTILEQLGMSIWREPRPLLVPIVLVRSREPTPFLLSTDDGRGATMRQAIVRTAGELGIGIRLPSENDLAAWGVNLIGFPAPLGNPVAGQLQISGSLSWNIQALGWIGLWRMELNDVEHEWGIKGVGFDQAFANMVQGAVMLASGTGKP